MGFSSDEEDPSIASGDDEWGGGLESEGGGHSPFLEDSVEFDDKGNPVAVPVGGDGVDLPTLPMPCSPLRRSPRRFPQSSTNATGEVDEQPPAASGCTRPCSLTRDAAR